MLRVSSYTFGCKLNQSETDAALNLLVDSGYELVSWDSGADLYLINTCTVTTKGEQKARRLIRQVQKLWPGAVILAAGCYAVLEREKIEALGARVCALPDQPAQLCSLLAEQPLANNDELLNLLRSHIELHLAAGGRHLRPGVARQADFPEVLLRCPPSQGQTKINKISLKEITQQSPLSRPASSPIPEFKSQVRKHAEKRQRYFLKIQDGCNRTCSFCRIRIARGPSRSLALPLLVEQLQHLEAQGYAEAVITGVHINSYHYQNEITGQDYFLGDLLEALLGQTQYIRLRLSSLEPEGLESSRAQQLFRILASQRICPHFHISIQSGSEHILRQMRRAYTAAQQLRYIDRLRELRPQAFFSCDVIVGFPGEREENFLATCDLLSSRNFASIHSFSYSPRPGTDSFTMPRVQESIVKQRMQQIQYLAVDLHRKYLQRCLGQEVRVLLEEMRSGFWFGYSENYIRTRIAIDLESESQKWQCGDLVRVRLQQSNMPEVSEQQPVDSLEERILDGLPV